MTVIAARCFNRLRAENAGDDLVSNEGVLGSDDGIARSRKACASNSMISFEPLPRRM